ncbi:histidine phosphatase family protein [Cyclobacterium jeungdonense]|uniref:Histidine phosphatase family protein n=1 Tax=Cyclobacterium jeungdonense TaxID=708087 RepID=A0ABT8C961_9BACT|nr:histidine phosphatase family protein [Cyclobacterium jeungdonense]MDN3689299.1 histidine phosphatase family protein [Cyclobacterium jeungdonense]
MSSKKIYVVRHGQTDYNLKGVVQGSGINAPINETGKKQAELFFQNFKHIPFDRVFYSSLIRTRQSIEKFLTPDIYQEELSDLNEISWGDYEGLPMDHDENQYYLNMLKKWSSGELDHKIGGGESPIDVVARLKRAMDHIMSTGGNNLLICMHGRAIRILMTLLLGYDLRYMDVFRHENLCCYELHVEEDGNMVLDKYHPSPLKKTAPIS